LIGAGAGLMVPMGSSHKLRQRARDEFAAEQHWWARTGKAMVGVVC
jgi:hypothetical protein